VTVFYDVYSMALWWRCGRFTLPMVAINLFFVNVHFYASAVQAVE